MTLWTITRPEWAGPVPCFPKPRTSDAVLRYLHDLRQDALLRQFSIEDANQVDFDDLEPPAPSLEVLCRAMPIATLGKGTLGCGARCGRAAADASANATCEGAASFANKLDAVLFVLLLEVGHEGLSSYNQMVINNCSDQGRAASKCLPVCLYA